MFDKSKKGQAHLSIVDRVFNKSNENKGLSLRLKLYHTTTIRYDYELYMARVSYTRLSYECASSFYLSYDQEAHPHCISTACYMTTVIDI